jgi:hypothetical protein
MIPEIHMAKLTKICFNAGMGGMNRNIFNHAAGKGDEASAQTKR